MGRRKKWVKDTYKQIKTKVDVNTFERLTMIVKKKEMTLQDFLEQYIKEVTK